MIINTNIHKELVLALDTFNTTDIYAWLEIHIKDNHVADVQLNRRTRKIIGIDISYPKPEYFDLLKPLFEKVDKIFNWIEEVI